MKNDVLVSVIMPVYNGIPLIKQSINSLLRQTYENWECIIINDGSIDGTKDYIESLTDKRFRIYSFETNKGRPYARQKGLEMAKGKYLAMLDADDIYHPNKLEIQVALMKKYPEVYLVSSGMCLYGTKTKIIRVLGKGNGKVEQYNGEQDFPLCHASSMIINEETKHFKYNVDLDTGEDIDFLAKYLDGRKYIKQQDVLYYYSMFDSVTKNKLIHNTLVHIKKEWKERKIYYLLKLLLKLVIQNSIFPFLDINLILSRKGISPTQDEIADFNKYCYIFIES